MNVIYSPSHFNFRLHTTVQIKRNIKHDNLKSELITIKAGMMTKAEVTPAAPPPSAAANDSPIGRRPAPRQEKARAPLTQRPSYCS